MDHKVSKDMISSGMIPSGEKTQADLGRTQYGSAPSPSSLMEAYRSIYEHHQKDKDGNTIPHEGEQLNEGKMPEGLKNYLMKKKGKKDVKEGNQRDPESSKKDKTHSNQPDPSKDGFTGIGNMSVKDIMKMNAKMKKDKKEEMKKESVDLFDLVKGKLIDEGCEEKEALKIMANMTKEGFDEVSEGLAGMALKLGGAALGAYGVKKAAEKMGTMSGTPKPVKKPGLIQKLKDRTSATNKAIEQM